MCFYADLKVLLSIIHCADLAAFYIPLFGAGLEFSAITVSARVV
jgi:hypothetical protein